MYKISCTIFFLLFIAPLYSIAQITPSEGSTLNYRLIGFSFPTHSDATRYIVEIAAGSYTSEDDFQKNIIDTSSSKKNRIIAEVSDFDAQYTWRVIYLNDHITIKKSELYHFNTLTDHNNDPAKKRLRILAPAVDQKDLFVFVDANKTLYDMAGNPVWYLPHMDGVKDSSTCHDLKSSCWSSITFMVRGQACEINYNGKLLWKEPVHGIDKKHGNQNTPTFYRNEFTRLANGHYMTIEAENTLWDLPGQIDSAQVRNKKKIVVDNNGKIKQKVLSGSLIEFDQKHNIIWSWSTTDYYKNSDLYYRRKSNGLFEVSNTNDIAFYFDEKVKIMYVSFGNVNRVVKLQYPGGKILNTYGPRYEPGDLEMNNDLFCGQNDCRRSQYGYLYFFNNNTCNSLCGGLPAITILREPTTPKGSLTKLWEYECTLDSMTEEERSSLKFKTGGSVSELPDQSLLCCMGGNYSKIFIVNREKKILWSAIPEQWNEMERKWKRKNGYHASIITRKELESLIWGEPLKK